MQQSAFDSRSAAILDELGEAGATATHSGPARPRLLILVTLAEVGGVGSFLATLLPALTPSFDVVVGAYGPGPLEELALSAGARYVPLRHVRRPLRPWRDLAGVVELWRLFRRERPHIVHANSSKAGALGRIAAVLANVPIRIFTVHGWAASAQVGFACRIYRLVERAASRLTTTVVCVAESERQFGLRSRMCKADQTVVIHNGIDIADAPRATHGASIPQVISVGRLKWPKDFATLVDALARLDAASCSTLLVGDGPQRATLSRQIERLGLVGSMSLPGERRDVPDLLAGSDVFVLSSASEALPISILEAMAAGLPVIASDVGGVPELVIDEETGLLVPPGDPEAVARALARLVADRGLRRQLGAAGRRRVEEQFGVERFRRAYIDLYARLLAERRLPVPAAWSVPRGT